jgi:hypothetical protein
VISYFAVVSYSRSINTLTDDYLTKLVQRIAEQTDALGQIHFKYIDILVKFPFVLFCRAFSRSFWPTPSIS